MLTMVAEMVMVCIAFHLFGQCFSALVAYYNKISLEFEKVPVIELHPLPIIFDSNDSASMVVIFTSTSEYS